MTEIAIIGFSLIGLIIGFFVGRATLRTKMDSIKRSLRDKTSQLRDMTASFTRTREELKVKIESSAITEEELSRLKTEYSEVTNNYESLKLNSEKQAETYQLEINRLREDYANKERDFQHISAVTVGLSPVKAALRKYESEIIRLQKRIKYLETTSPENGQNGGHQRVSDSAESIEEELETVSEFQPDLTENIESSVENESQNQAQTA